MSLFPETGPYIPDSDNGAMMWLRNFAERIALDPAMYGITPEESAWMSARAADYAAAYKVANNAKTRTTSTVKAKDVARRQAEEYGRMLAMRIKPLQTIDDREKIVLGLHLDDQSRTPINAPTTVPMLAIVAAGCGTHTLRFWDSATPTSRRKPPGATHMLLFAEVSPPQTWPTGNEDNLRFVAAVTRNPHVVSWNGTGHLGGTVLYKARWLTAKGLLGNWSAPVTMTIPAGGSTAASAQRDGQSDTRLALAA